MTACQCSTLYSLCVSDWGSMLVLVEAALRCCQRSILVGCCRCASVSVMADPLVVVATQVHDSGLSYCSCGCECEWPTPPCTSQAGPLVCQPLCCVRRESEHEQIYARKACCNVQSYIVLGGAVLLLLRHDCSSCCWHHPYSGRFRLQVRSGRPSCCCLVVLCDRAV